MLWGVSQPLLPCVCMKTQHSKNNLKQPGCLAGEKKIHRSLLVSSRVRIVLCGLYCVRLELCKHKRLE